VSAIVVGSSEALLAFRAAAMWAYDIKVITVAAALVLAHLGLGFSTIPRWTGIVNAAGTEGCSISTVSE
jgi:hypothetical protein